MATDLRPKTRVVFYHCGAHQYIVDVATTDIVQAIQEAISKVAAEQEDLADVREWHRLSRNNHIAVIPIN